MNKSAENKIFWAGFVIGVLFFIAANIFSLFPNKKGFKLCMDCYCTYGFPFPLYESGTIAHLDQFIWSGIAADISLTIVVGFLLGLTFNLIYSKISLHRIK